jgi:hypothetical protein
MRWNGPVEAQRDREETKYAAMYDPFRQQLAALPRVHLEVNTARGGRFTVYPAPVISFNASGYLHFAMAGQDQVPACPAISSFYTGARTQTAAANSSHAHAADQVAEVADISAYGRLPEGAVRLLGPYLAQSGDFCRHLPYYRSRVLTKPAREHHFKCDQNKIWIPARGEADKEPGKFI